MGSNNTVNVDSAEAMTTDVTKCGRGISIPVSDDKKDQISKEENSSKSKLRQIKVKGNKEGDSERWHNALRSPKRNIKFHRNVSQTRNQDNETQMLRSVSSSPKQKSKIVLSDILLETPDVILSFFNDGIINIPSILNVGTLNPQELIKGLLVIHKVCTSANDTISVTELVNALAVSKSIFITTVSLLVSKKLSNTLITDDDFLLVILDLLGLLVEKMPASSSETLELLLPQMRDVSRQMDCDEKYCEKFQELEKAKEYLATIVLPNDLSENTSDSDFRLLPTVPTICEILSHKPPVIYSAIIDGSYRDIEHYLNIQYRLMREDMFRDLKKCILDYLSHKDLKNGRVYHCARFENVKMSMKGKILYFSVILRWDVNWRTSKRLTPGSLVCLSDDGFGSFRFASIHNRKPDNGSGKICYVGLHFESDGELENVSALYEIIEAGSFFESYCYVAENLKQLDTLTFPLQESLINFQYCNNVPFILDDVQENELKKVQDELKDNIQAEAFELVLRNKVALIQGPPGTGKSYLGIQIARYLLEIVQIKTPIIVMCHTNHALDQFLEKMLDFTSKVIRVGGRSKNERLKAHNLNNIIDSVENFKGSVETLCEISLKIMACQNDRNMKLLMEQSNRYFAKKFSDISDFLTAMQSLDIAHDLLAENITMPFRYMRNTAYQNLNHKYRNLTDKLNEQAKFMNYPFVTEFSNSEQQKVGLRRFVKRFINSEQQEVRLADLFGLKPRPHREDVMRNSLCAVFHASKGIKLHHWLLTDPNFCYVYDEMREFREILIEELLNYKQLKEIAPGKARNERNSENEIELKPFLSLLLRLYKMDDARHFKMSSTHSRTVEEFITKELKGNVDVFKLFLKSAVRWCEENGVVIELENVNLWTLNIMERWKLLSLWTETIYSSSKVHESIDNIMDDIKTMKEFESKRDRAFLSSADIIGITTTGAAKHFDLLRHIKPTTYIIEEAAEVFESHITASLMPTVEHLILIGDHFQLRPTPTVYDLAVKYHLDVSLFERLFKNGVPSKCLRVQHRMRPSIAQLMVPVFYKDLENHLSVTQFDDVAGMSSNIFFLQHSKKENSEDELKSHSNPHEAKFLVSLSEYLVKQGHPLTSITILTTYIGQLHLLRKYIRESKTASRIFVTTVDNYQGEENDIILVSFVRSNIENKTGFIKTSNRICVALSRARKGLYCMGNFKMFASQSEIWKSLIIKLAEMNSFGDKLPVNCPQHPENFFLISTSRDLDQHIKLGCQELCNNPLPCSHKCDLLCHEKKVQHMGSFCNFECRQYLPCGHLQISNGDKTKCNEVIISSTRCGENVEYVCGEVPNHQNCSLPLLLQCGHSIPCTVYVNPSFSVSHYICLEFVTKVFPCGHLVVKPCNEANNYKARKCVEIIPVTFLCGHNVFMQCNKIKYRKAIKCVEQTTVTLLCGHSMSGPCSQIANHEALKCMEPTTVTLLCGHSMSGPCSQTANHKALKCMEPTAITLTCGHSKSVPCSSNSSLHYSLRLNCMETVTLTLSCGHKFSGPCNETMFKICRERTVVMLKCGHSMSVPCNETSFTHSLILKCVMLTTLTLPCGHNFSGPCNETTNKAVLCKEPTTVTLKCGHSMSAPCNEASDIDSLTLNCMETTRLTLPCGHNFSGPCKDTAKKDICKEPTTITFKCGHSAAARCNEASNKATQMACQMLITTTLACGHLSTIIGCQTKSSLAVQCEKTCKTVLKCGHRCSRKCYQCSLSGVHAICKVSASKFDCPFISCQKRCLRRCVHSQCINPCYAVCVSCTKACTWSCKHFRCGKRCNELCDRPPCDKPCQKLNPACGHSCSGYCGEPCPISCAECDGGSKIIVNTKRLVLLEDCGHSVPSDELSVFLAKSLIDSFPQCPKCHFPILQNTRFGNMLKPYFETRHQSRAVQEAAGYSCPQGRSDIHMGLARTFLTGPPHPTVI